MRRMIAAGVLMALALLIPASPASAQAENPGLDAACKTIERKIFTDIRKLVTIDLDTATDEDIQVLAGQILSKARADELPVLPPALDKLLEEDKKAELRAFLKDGLLNAWRTDLRISIGRSMVDAGPNVDAAAQKVLDSENLDDYLAYLNEGLYAARELDCAPTPGPTATATANPTPTTTTSTTPVPSPTATAPGGGGGLPVTGASIGTAVGVGAGLLLLGAVGYLIGRRRRSRFVA